MHYLQASDTVSEEELIVVYIKDRMLMNILL